MALIKCPECGKEISNRVKVCPHCKLDIEEYNKRLEEKQTEVEEIKRLEEKERLKELESKEKCPECGILVDKEVENCPNCGFPIREEKERIKAELDNKRKKYRKNIAIVVVASVLICSCLGIGYVFNRNSKYEKAMQLLENNKFYEAKDIFKSLNDYKDSEKMLDAIDIGCTMLDMINTDNHFKSSDLFDPYKIDFVLSSSEEYEILDDIRHKTINHLYDVAEKYIDTGNDDDYEYVQYLINSISKYIDTQKLLVKKQNAEIKKQNTEIFDIVWEKMKAREYSEIVGEFDRIEQKDEDVQILSDSYKELYEIYGDFLGDWGSSSGHGGFEFSILFDYFSTQNTGRECYFEIKKSGVILDNLDLGEGESSWGYSNLKVDGNTMSFNFITGGVNPEFQNAVCVLQDGDMRIEVDGHKINIGSNTPSGNSRQKKAPQLGDSATDVKLSSWGSPDK